MPRANRHFHPGQVWHITHRCHKKWCVQALYAIRLRGGTGAARRFSPPAKDYLRYSPDRGYLSVSTTPTSSAHLCQAAINLWKVLGSSLARSRVSPGSATTL